MEQKQLVPQEIAQSLKTIANLRNSVAHKQIIGGMTTYASYEGKPIFDDDYVTKVSNNPELHFSGVNEDTLGQLTTDIHHAVTTLGELRQTVLKGTVEYRPSP